MTILCWLIFAVITVISLFVFVIHCSFVSECRCVNVGALTAGGVYSGKNGYLNKKITYLLSTKQNNIVVNPSLFMNDVNKHMNGLHTFCYYMFCLQLVIYSALAYVSLITLNVLFALFVAAVLEFVLILMLNKIFVKSKIGDAQNLFRTIISKFCIMPADYSKETLSAIGGIQGKVENVLKVSTDYSNISKSLNENMQSVFLNIKKIAELASNYTSFKTTKEENDLSDQVNKLKGKINKIEELYKSILADSKAKNSEIDKYIDFFNNYNGFYSDFGNVEKSLITLLDSLKSEDVSLDEQLKEIKLLLHGITAKQLNEVKSIVDAFVSDVFGRMTFLFESNLERTNQTLAAMERLYEQGNDTIKAVNEYNVSLQNNLFANSLHNSKVNELISNNVQLVSFVLKRHKYIDGNVFNKLGSLVAKSPIETTDVELTVIKDKLKNLQMAVDKLK